MAFRDLNHATIRPGEWDQVMPLIKRCHDKIRIISPNLVTIIKIKDNEGEYQKSTCNVASVEEKFNHTLKTEPAKEPLSAAGGRLVKPVPVYII